VILVIRLGYCGDTLEVVDGHLNKVKAAKREENGEGVEKEIFVQMCCVDVLDNLSPRT